MQRRIVLKRAAALLAPTGLTKLTTASGNTAGSGSRNKQATAIDILADAARRTERLRAIVVLKQGEVAMAESFRGPAVDQAVNVKSVSKSVVAGLVGCALEQGALEHVGQTLDELAPELIPANADARVGKLTVKDFLTMRLGLQRQSGPAYGRWANSDDWVSYALTRPFTAEPGGRMLYSTAGWHVLGAALASATGKSLRTLALEWLGKPLGIEFAPWTRDPQGRYLGGNEMSMSPLEMANFGELYRMRGRWNEQQVMPTDWVTESFNARTISPWSNDGYGYGWFIRTIGGVPAAYARGYGGQLIHVVPDAGLVVAITSGTNRAARSRGYMDTLHTIVGDYVRSEAG